MSTAGLKMHEFSVVNGFNAWTFWLVDEPRSAGTRALSGASPLPCHTFICNSMVSKISFARKRVMEFEDLTSYTAPMITLLAAEAQVGASSFHPPCR
jgi:hypothetical protein